MAAILRTRKGHQYCEKTRDMGWRKMTAIQLFNCVGELGLVPLGSSVRSCLPNCPYIFEVSTATSHYLQHLCLFGCDLIIEFSVAQ